MMKNSKGFTLMEILAVLLVIAVIASFAVPLIKSVRREMRYQQAKAAGVQLAEAVRSFYADTKGCLATSKEDSEGFSTEDVVGASLACPEKHPIAKGIPGSLVSNNCDNNEGLYERIVFACNYISPKIFTNLPYTFKVLDPRRNDYPDEVAEAFVKGTENASSGDKPREFVVHRDMTVTEDE